MPTKLRSMEADKNIIPHDLIDHVLAPWRTHGWIITHHVDIANP